MCDIRRRKAPDRNIQGQALRLPINREVDFKMESTVIMNAFHHATWGEPIAIYFFLLGISIGAFILSAFGWVFHIDKYKPIGLISSIIALGILLVVPPFFLITDLE